MMVNEKQQELESKKEPSSQSEALEGHLGNMLSGVERSLAVTCESIMGKMKQLEEKIQDMEKRYTDLAKDAENALKEASDTTQLKDAGETADSKK